MTEYRCTDPQCGKLLYGKVAYCPFCGVTQQSKPSLVPSQPPTLASTKPVQQEGVPKSAPREPRRIPSPPLRETPKPDELPPSAFVGKASTSEPPDQHRTETSVKGIPNRPTTIATETAGAPPPKTLSKSRIAAVTAGLVAAVIGVGMFLGRTTPPAVSTPSTKHNDAKSQKETEQVTPVAKKRDISKAEEAVRRMLTAQMERNEKQLQDAKASLDALEKPQHQNRKVARDFNAEGLRMMSQNHFSAALKQFSFGTQADPADVELLANLGLAKLQAHDTDGAISAIVSALALSSDRVASWTALAQSLASSGDTDNAVGALRVAYRFAGNKEEIIQQFRELRGQQSNAQVIAALDRVLKDFANDARVSHSGPVTKSKGDPRRVPATPVSEPRSPVAKPFSASVIADAMDDGDACMANKKYDCAINNAKSVLRIEPGNRRAQILKARAETEKNK